MTDGRTTRAHGPGRFAEKVALVTGAARGQGRNHAVRLAAEGAHVIILDICGEVPSSGAFYPGTNEDQLEETRHLIEQTGQRAIALRIDVRDRATMAHEVDRAVDELGGLDIVVANAGVLTMAAAHEMTSEAWSETLDINLTGVWNTTSVATPHLIHRGGGTMVLTSSTAGLRGTPHLSAYTASKHGVVGLMRCLVLELGAHSIRVNTVHPCAVATDMILNDAMYQLFAPDVPGASLAEARTAYERLNVLPIPWIGVDDVSNAVLFLASDEAQFVTGCELTVDAGATVK